MHLFPRDSQTTDQGSHSASGEGHLAPAAVEIKGSRKEQLCHFSHLSFSHLYPKETDPGVRTEATIEISHLKFMQAFVSGNWLDSQIPFSCSPKGLLKELLSPCFLHCSPISSLFLASDSSQAWQISLWFLLATFSNFPSNRLHSNPTYVKNLLLGGSNAF